MMKKILGILLIVGAIVLGYFGVEKWNDSSKSLSIGKLEVSAEKTSERNMAYFFLGGAVALLVGGILVLKK